VKDFRKSLFILGAGASRELNMPTGIELKDLLIGALSAQTEGNRIVPNDPLMFQILQNISPTSMFTSGGTFEASQRIKTGLVTARSIDNLLEAHMSDALAVRVGKAAICRTIMRAEGTSLLASPGKGMPPDLSSASNTWYGKFLQLIVDGTKFDKLSEKLKRLTVVTFNYDRTLEHFLYHAISEYYGVARSSVPEVLSSLRIIHPYGTAGRLPWQEVAGSVEFGADVGSGDLLRLSEGIVTFSEGSSEELGIDWSLTRRIVFLGFAYHRINMQFLFPEKITPTADRFFNSINIYGSAKDVSPSNQKEIENELLGIFGKASNVSFLGVTCSKFIEDFWHSLLL